MRFTGMDRFGVKKLATDHGYNPRARTVLAPNATWASHQHVTRTFGFAQDDYPRPTAPPSALLIPEATSSFVHRAHENADDRRSGPHPVPCSSQSDIHPGRDLARPPPRPQRRGACPANARHLCPRRPGPPPRVLVGITSTCTGALASMSRNASASSERLTIRGRDLSRHILQNRQSAMGAPQSWRG